MSNPVLDLIDYMGVEPQNRSTYMKTAFPGKAPAKLDSETEAGLPDEPRFKAFKETTHEEQVAEEKAKEKGTSKGKGKATTEDVFPSGVPRHLPEPVVPVRPHWDDRQDDMPMRGGNIQNAAPTNREAFPEPQDVER
jgi:hypothetical protein